MNPQLTTAQAKALFALALHRPPTVPVTVNRPRTADVDRRAAENLARFHAEVRHREIVALGLRALLVLWLALLAGKFIIDWLFS